MILRKEKKNQFTQIPNEIIYNPNLTIKAKLILICALSLPDCWNFSILSFAHKLGVSKDIIRSGLTELQICGYLVVGNRRRNSRGQLTKDTEYTFFEEPQEKNSINRITA